MLKKAHADREKELYLPRGTMAQPLAQQTAEALLSLIWQVEGSEEVEPFVRRVRRGLTSPRHRIGIGASLAPARESSNPGRAAVERGGGRRAAVRRRRAHGGPDAGRRAGRRPGQAAARRWNDGETYEDLATALRFEVADLEATLAGLALVDRSDVTVVARGRRGCTATGCRPPTMRLFGSSWATW